MKQSITWHEEMLKRRQQHAARCAESVRIEREELDRIVRSNTHYALQIESARRAGKDSFDEERFMRKTT